MVDVTWFDDEGMEGEIIASMLICLVWETTIHHIK